MNDEMQAPGQKPDFLESLVSKEKREAIGRDAGRAKWLIAVITFIGQQIGLNLDSVKNLLPLIMKANNPGSGSVGDYLDFWNIFVMTAPFIIAIAGLYVVATGMIKRGDGFGMGHAGAAAVILYLAALIGNALGFAVVRTAGLRGGTPIEIMALQLMDYFNSYGFILFGSSAVVGWFLGQAWKTLESD